MKRAALIAFAGIVCAVAFAPLVADETPRPVWPGYQGSGVTLLPSGWKLAPAGRHVEIGGLPMNLVPSPDGRFLAISSSGWTKPSITIFDTHTLQIVSRADVDHTWLGLVWHPDGRRIFLSGASENLIYEYAFENGKVSRAGTIPISDAERHPGRDVVENAGYVAGMALSPDGKRLYAAQIYGQKVRAIDIAQKQVARPRSSMRNPTPASCRRTAARCTCRCGAPRRWSCSTPPRSPNGWKSRSASIRTP